MRQKARSERNKDGPITPISVTLYIYATEARVLLAE